MDLLGFLRMGRERPSSIEISRSSEFSLRIRTLSKRRASNLCFLDSRNQSIF